MVDENETMVAEKSDIAPEKRSFGQSGPLPVSRERTSPRKAVSHISILTP